MLLKSGETGFWGFCLNNSLETKLGDCNEFETAQKIMNSIYNHQISFSYGMQN